MNLFIIRHAIAEERSAGKADEKRRLTSEGREKWKREIRGLKALGIRFDPVFHSPWTRAVETAELLDGEKIETTALARPPRDELLHELRGPSAAVVGHEPWLGELIAWLVTSDAALGPRFVMKKGGVAWLEGTPKPGRMRLLALLPPKALRAAGR